MNLYIEIENNQPKNHPAVKENLIQAFGSVPSNWEKFVRIPKPTLSVYEIFDSETSTYEKVNGVWTDVWHIREMTQEEKIAKQNRVKEFFYSLTDASNFSTWIFDEEKCEFVPPIEKPNDGKKYFWQGKTNSWVLFPPYPTDGKDYMIDYDSGQWVEVQ